MKINILYIAGFVLSLMTVSCTDDPLVNYSRKELRITGNVGSDSRTTFVQGDGFIKMHWEVDDMIGIFTDKQTNLPYKATNAGKTTEFTPVNKADQLEKLEGQTVYAYYPYTQESLDIDSIKMGSNFIYSQAKIVNGELNFQFKHAYSYLKINLPAEDIKEQLSQTQRCYNKELSIKNAVLDIQSPKFKSPLTVNPLFSLKKGAVSNEPSTGFNRSIYLKNIDLEANPDTTYTFFVGILPQPENAEIVATFSFRYKDSYESVEPLNMFPKVIPEGGLKAGHVYSWNFANNNLQERLEKTKQLLTSFYHKTGGDQWHENENWLSDKPFGEWYGLSDFGTSKTNEIEFLYLPNNGLSGQIPEELAELMDLVYEKEHMTTNISPIELWGNNFVGVIPEVVKNHRRWGELGWYIVADNPNRSEVLDLTDCNLYIENMALKYIYPEAAADELYDIVKENKLTQIVFINSTNFDDVIERLSDYHINTHLDYQNKGLKTLIYLGPQAETYEKEWKQNIHDIYGSVEGIGWLKGRCSIPTIMGQASYFFDSDGQLLHFAHFNATCPSWEEDLIRERCTNFLRSYLGEPENHPEFSVPIYTSTDYSRDGEVVTLQEATVGQGINLTFLGDAYVDKDMEPGGLYEQAMREAMEQFFSFEPYKSMRNRFNVYAVKAVSPNSIDLVELGTKRAIRHDNSVCFKYAQKIPNADKNPPMVTVVYRKFFWDRLDGRSHCYVYNDGSFVAYLLDGLESPSVLMHEAGGHGFGGLLDEYVEPGNEKLTFPESDKINLDAQWANYGIGANVDWRNSKTIVKWSHFLKDSRYADEGLGLYEGAHYYAYGVYRPSENSMMRYNNGPFNAPSREQIYKRIMQRSEGADWKYDYEEFVKYDEINRKSATRASVRTLTDAERREYIKKHCPPTLIKGTWRDAMKNGKSNTVVPLR